MTKGDLRDTAKLAGTALVSWLFPVEELSWVARKIRYIRGVGTGRSHRIDSIVARVLSEYISKQRAEEIDLDWRARVLEARMQILALHRPGRSWHPRIHLRGLEHLENALGRKSGALLWVSDFVYSSLITKMAFCQAGYSVTHLSRVGHGFSNTPFGIRVLNPLWIKIENQFIAERIIIDNENASRALGLLKSRLSANGVASITVGSQARRTLDVPFFKGAISIATGPAHLSQTSQAPLLPVFTFRCYSGAYVAEIGCPICGQTTSQEDYARMVGTYVTMLKQYVLSYPDQWNGWMSHVWREKSDLE
jgi:lauroyl/myristoyl acyltransferase